MPDFTDRIRQAVAHDHYVLTPHAIERMAERFVLEEEVVATILHGEVIESRPRARPCPKCLFMYPVRSGQPLYVSCAYDYEDRIVIVITVHWFDPDVWLDWRTRRRRRRRR